MKCFVAIVVGLSAVVGCSSSSTQEKVETLEEKIVGGATDTADPAVVEEWKWNVPVWSHDGIICTGESYKSVVKLTFARGAALKDPKRLFNSSLDGNVRRAIDIREGEEIDATAFTALVREAIALNATRKAKPAARKTARVAATKKTTKSAKTAKKTSTQKAKS